MRANPSSRWKNEIMPVIEENDFGLSNVYDAGPSFRQDDHQCDFCGTHLRYTAEIVAENNSGVEYKVGLDCLEHVMGTSWSHLQDVKRRIKNLKEEAKKKRRKEAYAEEYEEEIEWLERYLEIRDDNFLSDMHRTLTTGESEFTRKMHQAVLKNMRSTDLEEVKEKEKWIESVIDRLESLLEIIEESSKNDGAWGFVNSVLDFAQKNRRVTEKQLDAINDVYNRYENLDNGEQNRQKEAPAVPF